MIEQAIVNDLVGNVLENAIYLANFFKFRVNNPEFDFAQSMQIFSSNPRVTICKTFDEWNALQRRIIRSSKALSYINADNPTRKNYVFDISQTYGVDYPPKVYPARETLVDDLNKLNYVKNNNLTNQYDSLIKTIDQFNMENGNIKPIELENKYL